MAALIKKRISSPITTVAASDASGSSGVNEKPNRPSCSKMISAKLEDGNLKAAIRLLMSDDSFASSLAAVLASLQDKHPPSSLGL